ncbi:MAG TPA: YecH family metal-binding protein [Polyangiaceae bacterium]|nr:YecH family metal-binding protein [Polyangiaceae bacterium]
MSSSIHGHEVLEMMVTAGIPFTSASLRDAIIQRFGVEARFHTCSARDMDAAALVDFLSARGKFVPVSDGFVFSGKSCSHGDDADHHH